VDDDGAGHKAFRGSSRVPNRTYDSGQKRDTSPPLRHYPQNSVSVSKK
jgi:hypothetical protein